MKELKLRLEKYFKITGEAIKKVRISPPENTQLYYAARDFLDMATRYYDDARHFEKKKDYLNAFACLNYAHGWLDAGARIGLFDVGKDNKLFTVDDD